MAGPGVDAEVLARFAMDDTAPVVVLETDWTIVFANAAFAAYGYDPGDLIGTSALDKIHPDDISRALIAGDLLPSRAGYGTAPYRFLLPDGSWISLDVASVVLRPEDGRTYYGFSMRANPFDRARTEAFTAMVSGTSPQEALRGLTIGFSPARPAVLIAFDETDHREVIGPLPSALAGVFGGRQDRTPGTPWAKALEEMWPVTIETLDGLPEPVRAAAEAKGLKVASFLATPDPGRPQPALLTAWSDDPVVSSILAVNLADIEALVRLALERRSTHERLDHLAHHDPLTNLPNRASFFAQLAGAVAQSRPLAVAYLDLDGFKEVNDQHGHAAGDEVLIEFGRRFGREMRAGDLVARLGGDEFGVLLVGQPDEATARRIIERLVAASQEPVDIGGTPVTLAASAGLVVVEDATTTTADALVRRADTALYRAKAEGPGRVVLAEART